MHTTPRDANLLGALGLAVADRLEDAAELAGGTTAAGALIALAGTSARGTIDALARVVGLSHSGTVRLVDRLERDGLVERRRSQSDRRVNALHLTEKGREILAAARAAREQAMDELTRPFRAGEEEELCALLRELLGVPHPS
jgi:MarR family transcriptional regulator, negative regulator of the multidrug operon emrRAB